MFRDLFYYSNFELTKPYVNLFRSDILKCRRMLFMCEASANNMHKQMLLIISLFMLYLSILYTNALYQLYTPV